MFCPMMAKAFLERLMEDGEPLWFCQKDGCAWWVFVLGYGFCAVNALAQIARVAYENQGK